jgi:hypothetical protein
MSVVANELGLSPSEVHGAIQRLRRSRLLHGPALKDKPNISGLEEFLVHGLKYAFPAEHGQVTRGMATSYAAEPLKSEIAPSNDLPPVWPWAEGDTRGMALEPLYKSVPRAAMRDPALYELLALVDAIRDGRAASGVSPSATWCSDFGQFMANPNLQLLIDAARLLQPILGELVFVGGCATALLITDKAAADVRPTFDVDAIAEITSYAEYTEFSERLRKLGFQEDATEGAPLCRWRQKTTMLDVMPLDEKILGFSNSWYRPAMDNAEERELEKGLTIRLVAPTYFCASKLEAFRGRGNSDFLASRDLEDLVAVVDGRAELAGEIGAATSDVRSYLSKEIGKLLATHEFIDALPGYVPPDAASQERVATIMARLQEISSF